MEKLSLIIVFSLLVMLEAKMHCFYNVPVSQGSVECDESGPVTVGSLNGEPISKCHTCSCTITGAQILLDCCMETPKEPLFDESKCVKYFNSTESCEYKVKSKSKKEDEEEDSNCVITGYKPQE